MNAVKTAQAEMNNLLDWMKELLANPEGLSEAIVHAQLTKLTTVDIPLAKTKLENANIALKNCRMPRTLGGHGFPEMP